MRYWSSAPWTSVNQANTLINRDLTAMKQGDYLNFVMVRQDNNALIGTYTLFHLDAQCRRAEIGYGVNLNAWRKGYMHEALTTLLCYGFMDLNINRIEADIDPRNEASAKILTRLGFVKVGHLRERWIVDGEVSDTAFFGLLYAEWKTQQSA